MTTVGHLRKLIEGLPDDMPVVREGGDHSYFRAGGAEKITMLVHDDGTFNKHLYEDHGDDNKVDPKDERVDAVLID